MMQPSSACNDDEVVEVGWREVVENTRIRVFTLLFCVAQLTGWEGDDGDWIQFIHPRDCPGVSDKFKIRY